MINHGSGRTMDAAHESEEKYRNLIENISDWVWETDRDLKFTYTNPRIKDYLGYEPSEVLGRSMYDFMPPDWARRIHAFLEMMAREGKQVAICEKALRSKSGELVYFEMTINLIFDEKGRLAGYRGICRDIRDRLRAEELQHKAYLEMERRVAERTKELESARATLQAILDTVPIGILVIDARTSRVIYHSGNVEKIFGGPLVGKTYGVDMYPNQVLNLDGTPMKTEKMPLYTSLKSGDVVHEKEILVRQPDGEELTVLASSAPIRDEQGHITAAVAAIMDITKLKAAEHDLQKAKAESEMYLDLMGHDINNLSQVGIGYLEMALNKLDAEGGLEAKDRPLLAMALETQLNSSKLIDNVRKIQRSKAGGLKYRPIDLCDVLEEQKRGFLQTPGRQVNIRFTSRPRCYICANELVRDVFANLIGNAVKHAPADRPVEISIRLDKVRQNGKDYYRVSVEDNGPGIPDDLKKRLFGRFERGKTKASGRGLGLYLVKSLLDDMNGTISVEDRVPGEPGQGAKFLVMLPAIQGPAVEGQATS